MAEQILKTEYSDVMQKSYIDYAMSVICARALPDIRDGLKPVQRRVLFAMDELGLNHDKPHRKSARIVGDTMGKYHPHGDSSIYEALVVLEQDFKKGMALVDGHGNFGSIEGDGAAAMRYTEAKLKKFTQEVYLADLDKNVVDFVPNFDETEKEPVVLPVRVPNILINGAEGIAVGMTTNIPTHNLAEVIDAVTAYMDNNDITTEKLMEYMPGPDFPTGGLVVNKSELLNIYESGTGKIKVRGKVEFEEGKGRSEKDKLVITEIPYTMIGAGIGKFISDIAELVETKKTSDIVDISNQSSKEGIRIVLELKKGADVENLKNMLYKKTKLEDTFGVNMLAVVDGRPETLGLKDIIKHNVAFQFEITTRKYTSLLNKELEQKEIKEGLIKACNIIDLIIEILRGSQSLKDAKACLTKGDTSKIKFKNKESEIYASQLAFTDKQAQAILELRLYKLIGLEILALQKDYEDIVNRIAEYEDILGNPASMAKAIKKDLANIKKNYSIERRTVIVDAEQAVYVEKKIEEQQVMFIMDRFSYAKTIDMAAYERNKEAVHAENKYIFPCMNTDKLCLFTDTGMLHQIKILDLPFVKFRDKGTPIDNVGNYNSAEENIVYMVPAADIKNRKLLFTSMNGMMKLVDAEEFDVTKKTVAATKLGDGDKLLSITLTDAMEKSVAKSLSDDVIEPVMLSGGSFGDDMMGDDGFADGFDGGFSEGFDDSFGGFSMEMSFDDDMQMQFGMENQEESNAESGDDTLFTNEIVVLQTAKGMFLRFPLREIPEKKKGAVGVRGIKLEKDDYLTNVYVLDAGDNLEVEFKGKTVELRKIKTTKRDGKGTKVR
ncbi:MAG: DNA topoisomerase [Lachnospiraceae bacterium]|nr:DNA topoisomerase [Lachnospiraceae bacterium]